MIKQVWKTDLNLSQATNTTVVWLPVGTKLIHVQMQNNKVCLWYLVDIQEKNMERREFIIHGTGHNIFLRKNGAGEVYVGTAISKNDNFVWHVFEIKEK